MKIKLGIIGTGIAARDLHLPALQNLKNKFEIIMVCNHTEQKAKEFSKLVGGVPYVLNYPELLKNQELEAVDIILPIELNLTVTKDALEAGKHVIVEKPLASNVADAKLMAEFPNRYKKIMMVAENYRYNPVFKRINTMIHDQKIGEPYSVFWDQLTVTDTDNKYAKTKWRINHQYPGGFVTDAGVHNIAVLRDIFGEIKSGVAFNRSVNPGIGKMDSMSFSFVFESGVNGIFNMYFSAQGINENRLMIFGKEGTLVIEENRIILKRQGKPSVEEIVKTDRGYQEQFEDFYDCIVNGKQPISTFDEAYKDFRTIVAALDSANKWEMLSLY
jgi:predicted dehydrogenase